MMHPSEGYFATRDGTRLFYRTWEKSIASPNACILIHGYGDHSGRYREFIEALSDVPFAFYAFDLRGQGHSEGKRVFADSFAQYEEDCYDFLRFLEIDEELRSKKFFLLGHSLGGLIALQAVLKDEGKWSGLVLSSPCFQLHGVSWSPLLRGLVKILNQVAPRFVMHNLVKPRYLFHDPEKMKAYLKDPLIERKVTVHLANEIARTCSASQKRCDRLKIPVLVLASGNDRVVSLDATRAWFDHLQARDKTMITYPDLYHEIFNEFDSKPIQDLKKFFTSHAKG